MKTREDKGIAKLELFSKSAPFGHILNKSTQSLFGAWSFLLVHIRFTPSEGPESFVNWSYKKSDHESWTIKSERGKKGHLPWSMV